MIAGYGLYFAHVEEMNRFTQVPRAWMVNHREPKCPDWLTKATFVSQCKPCNLLWVSGGPHRLGQCSSVMVCTGAHRGCVALRWFTKALWSVWSLWRAMWIWGQSLPDWDQPKLHIEVIWDGWAYFEVEDLTRSSRFPYVDLNLDSCASTEGLVCTLWHTCHRLATSALDSPPFTFSIQLSRF